MATTAARPSTSTASPTTTYQGLDDRLRGLRRLPPIDRRWIWVAGVAGAILLVAVICTVVILGGGDSGSVTTTVVAPDHVTTGRHHLAQPPVATTPSAPPPAASLAAGNRHHRDTDRKRPAQYRAEPLPAPAARPPAPNTITYRVTGNRKLIDLVTVIYTD